jgi:hypothetical protein
MASSGEQEPRAQPSSTDTSPIGTSRHGQPIAATEESGAATSRQEATNRSASLTPSTSWTKPWPIFVLELLYLLALLIGIVLYQKTSRFHGLVPDPVGIIPLAVPWWGALGAITIGLYGVFFHTRDWNDSFNYWHLARPFTGAVLGIVSYLIFIVVIDASGAKPNTSGAPVYDLVAFLVAYNEQNFQDLIKRATDALFSSSGDSAVTPTPPRGHDNTGT